MDAGFPKKEGREGELRLSRRSTERMAHASLRVSLEHGNGREEQKVRDGRPRDSPYARPAESAESADDM